MIKRITRKMTGRSEAPPPAASEAPASSSQATPAPAASTSAAAAHDVFEGPASPTSPTDEKRPAWTPEQAREALEDAFATAAAKGSKGKQKDGEKSALAQRLQALVDKRIPVDAVLNGKNETALHLAARACDVDAIKVLLNANATVDATTIHGDTALHIAASEGGKLEKLPYDERRVDQEASARRLYTVCAVLLHGGAQASHANAKGEQPLHVLRSFPQKISLVQLFVRHGAKVLAEDKEGSTPLGNLTWSGGGSFPWLEQRATQEREAARKQQHQEVLAALHGLTLALHGQPQEVQAATVGALAALNAGEAPPAYEH